MAEAAPGQADLAASKHDGQGTADDGHEHHAGHCEHHHHGGAFDLTILVPRASFTSQSSPLKSASDGKSKSSLDDYVPLFLPATNADVLRDIKQSVADSAEGFWIGAHSYQRITLREEAPEHEGEEPKLSLESEDPEVFPETADLGTVFAGEEYKSHELRRALRAVETPYSDSEARAHVLRVRDASLSYTAALHAKRAYQPPPYDPSQMVIDAGLSLFPAIRGPVEDPEAQPTPEQTEAPQANGAQSGKSGKKSKGKAGTPAKQQGQPAPSAAKKESTAFEPSASFLDADQDALAIYQARKKLLPSSSLPPPAFKNLQLSMWNPPPQHLRLRGHYLYLSVATLEGENYHISATRDGFYVNRSDNHQFDPSPKSQPSKARPQAHITHHTLFGLLSALSPQFAERTQSLITDVVPMSPDFFASLAITTCQPAAPWLVPEPSPIADGARSQTAFLLTGSTNADYLPNSKDWNEELTSMRELPKETNDDKLLRDRYACRLHSDFQSAAARGVISIARGDVPPLNAIDASEANSYLAYNILFTPAQDSADTYKHLGGDEAARVTASKDVWATKLLSDPDITGLNTIATAIIDYCGERWIAQAIPPGIFNKTPLEEPTSDKKTEEEEGKAEKDESSAGTDNKAEQTEEAENKTPQTVALRAVYGPANTDKPYEKYVAEESFEPLAKKIAEHFHLAKHTVTDSKGRELEMWTPADVHGLIGSDSRMYAIDLFRLTPVDVKFLEEDATKILGEESSTSEKEDDVYPHRITLLRPELVEIYHSIKTREWIEQQVKEKTEQDKTTAASSSTAAIEDGNTSIEKPDSATSEEFVKVDKEEEKKADEAVSEAEKPKEKEQTVINVADFKLAFNPDAFVDRPDLPQGHWIGKKEGEDEQTKAVRDVSEYLRSTVIPALLAEVISEETLPLDSSELSLMMHRKGINMRYLGYIAEKCKEAPPLGGSLKRTPEAEQEVINFLAKFKSFLVGDMIMRGAKHVLRLLIKDINAIELTEAIAHFLNCLLGTGLVSDPKAVNTTKSSKSWTSLTPSTLRDRITREVRRRYRFVLPSGAFQEDVSKLRMLRELCMSSGIQMNLQNYTFEKSQANGHVEESSTQDQKKQAGKAKQARTASPVPAQRQTTFVPEDILNVHPVIKKAPFKSSMAEDLLERGQMYFIRGNIELGEAFVNDALNMYDQIFGAIHPEMAEAYRQIGGLYHRMAAPLMRRIQLYEQTRSLTREEDREKIKTETGIDSEEALEQAKYQHEIYLQQAVKLTRQAVIISERVNGIDSAETLHYYSELAFFEHSVGNVELALKLLQHTVALSNAIYGDNHPEKARAAFFAASMIKTFQPQNHLAAVPFFRSAQALAQKAYGANSIMSANASYQLGQCYIVDGQLAASIPYIEEALRIFELRHGKEGDHTRDATQLLNVVKTAIEQEAKGELEKVQKLAKRIGADPARAKELISKLQGSSTSSFARRGGRSSAQIAADDAVQASNGAVKAAKDTTGTKGHLDVDDLVLFIEGGQKKASTSGGKSGKSKKGGSKK